MKDLEKFRYALSRYQLALLVGDKQDAETWKEHVRFWENELQTKIKEERR